MPPSYDLEIPRIISEVKERKAKRILLQFPDGLKPYAYELVDKIREEADAIPIIFFGSCFGACDIPISLIKDVDLIIQFGHNLFIKNPEGWRENEPFGKVPKPVGD